MPVGRVGGLPLLSVAAVGATAAPAPETPAVETAETPGAAQATPQAETPATTAPARSATVRAPRPPPRLSNTNAFEARFRRLITDPAAEAKRVGQDLRLRTRQAATNASISLTVTNIPSAATNPPPTPTATPAPAAPAAGAPAPAPAPAAANPAAAPAVAALNVATNVATNALNLRSILNLASPHLRNIGVGSFVSSGSAVLVDRYVPETGAHMAGYIKSRSQSTSYTINREDFLNTLRPLGVRDAEFNDKFTGFQYFLMTAPALGGPDEKREPAQIIAPVLGITAGPAQSDKDSEMGFYGEGIEMSSYIYVPHSTHEVFNPPGIGLTKIRYKADYLYVPDPKSGSVFEMVDADLTTDQAMLGGGAGRYVPFMADRIPVIDKFKDSYDKTKAFYADDSRSKSRLFTFYKRLGEGRVLQGQIKNLDYKPTFSSLEYEPQILATHISREKLLDEKTLKTFSKVVIDEDLLVRIMEHLRFAGAGGFDEGSTVRYQDSDIDIWITAGPSVLASQLDDLKLSSLRPAGLKPDQSLATFFFEMANHDGEYAGKLFVKNYEGTSTLRTDTVVSTSTNLSTNIVANVPVVTTNTLTSTNRVFSGLRTEGPVFDVSGVYSNITANAKSKIPTQYRVAFTDYQLGFQSKDGRYNVDPGLGSRITAAFRTGEKSAFVDLTANIGGEEIVAYYDKNEKRFETTPNAPFLLKFHQAQLRGPNGKEEGLTGDISGTLGHLYVNLPKDKDLKKDNQGRITFGWGVPDLDVRTEVYFKAKDQAGKERTLTATINADLASEIAAGTLDIQDYQGTKDAVRFLLKGQDKDGKDLDLLPLLKQFFRDQLSQVVDLKMEGIKFVQNYASIQVAGDQLKKVHRLDILKGEINVAEGVINSKEVAAHGFSDSTTAEYLVAVPGKDLSFEKLFQLEMASTGEAELDDKGLQVQGQIQTLRAKDGDPKNEGERRRKGFDLVIEDSSLKIENFQDVNGLIQAIQKKDPALLKSPKGTINLLVNDKPLSLKAWDADGDHPFFVMLDILQNELKGDLAREGNAVVIKLNSPKPSKLTGILLFDRMPDGKPKLKVDFENLSSASNLDLIYQPQSKTWKYRGIIDSLTTLKDVVLQNKDGTVARGGGQFPTKINLKDLEIKTLRDVRQEMLRVYTDGGSVEVTGKAYMEVRDALGRASVIRINSDFDAEMKRLGVTIRPNVNGDHILYIPEKNGPGTGISFQIGELRMNAKNSRNDLFIPNGKQSVWVSLEALSAGATIKDLVFSPEQMNIRLGLAGNDINLFTLIGTPTTSNELDLSQPHDVIHIGVKKTEASFADTQTASTDSTIQLGMTAEAFEAAYGHRGDAFGAALALAKIDRVEEAQLLITALNKALTRDPADGKWKFDKTKLKGGFKLRVSSQEDPQRVYNVFVNLVGSLPATAITGQAQLELPSRLPFWVGALLTGSEITGQVNPKPGAFLSTSVGNDEIPFVIDIGGKKYYEVLNPNKISFDVSPDGQVHSSITKTSVTSLFSVQPTDQLTPILNGLALVQFFSRNSAPEAAIESAPLFDDLPPQEQQALLQTAHYLQSRGYVVGGRDQQAALNQQILNEVYKENLQAVPGIYRLIEHGIYRNYLDGLTRLKFGLADLREQQEKAKAKTIVDSWEALSPDQEESAITFARLNPQAQTEVRQAAAELQNSGYLPGADRSQNLEATAFFLFKRPFGALAPAERAQVQFAYQMMETAAPKIYDVRHDPGEDRLVELIYGDPIAQAHGFEVWNELTAEEQQALRSRLPAARQLDFTQRKYMWDCAVAGEFTVDANATPSLDAAAKQILGPQARRYYELSPNDRKKVTEAVKAQRAKGQPFPRYARMMPAQQPMMAKLGFKTDPVPFGLGMKLLRIDVAHIDMRADPDGLRSENVDPRIHHAELGLKDVSLLTRGSQVEMKMVFYQGRETAMIPLGESESYVLGDGVSEFTFRVGVDAYGNPADEGNLEMRYGTLIPRANRQAGEPVWDIDWKNSKGFVKINDPNVPGGIRIETPENHTKFKKWLFGQSQVMRFGMSLRRGQEPHIFTEGQNINGFIKVFDWCHYLTFTLCPKFTTFEQKPPWTKLPGFNEFARQIGVANAQIEFEFVDIFAFLGITPQVALAHKSVNGTIEYKIKDSKEIVRMPVKQGLVLAPNGVWDGRSTMDEYLRAKFLTYDPATKSYVKYGYKFLKDPKKFDPQGMRFIPDPVK